MRAVGAADVNDVALADDVISVEAVVAEPDQLDRDLAAILGLGEGAPALDEPRGQGAAAARLDVRILVAGVLALSTITAAMIMLQRAPPPPHATIGPPALERLARGIAPPRASNGEAPRSAETVHDLAMANVPAPQARAESSDDADTSRPRVTAHEAPAAPRPEPSSPADRHAADRVAAERVAIATPNRASEHAAPRPIEQAAAQPPAIVARPADAPPPRPSPATPRDAGAGTASAPAGSRLAMAAPVPQPAAVVVTPPGQVYADGTSRRAKRKPARKLESIDAIRSLRRQ